MSRHSVVVIGASAGGLPALQVVIRDLPPDLAAPVLIVQHLDPHRASQLTAILRRATALLVEEAGEGAALTDGTIVVAKPDRHLVIGPDGCVHLSADRPVHFLRPSVDVLFESAAAVYGAGTVAVVLTGSGHDGADGVVAVKTAGGTTIAQDAGTSANFGMPSAAIATGMIDRILPLTEIAAALVVSVERHG